jgi:cytochrome c peroxidase
LDGHSRISGAFKLLFQGSVVVLTLLLAAWFWNGVFRPFVAMQRHADAFEMAAAGCGQAIASVEAAEHLTAQLDASIGQRLQLSFDVAKLPCQELAILREDLLSEGVSPHSINARYLRATSDPAYPALNDTNDHPISLDVQLATVIRGFGLSPLPLKTYEHDAKFRLGEALFFDPALSGTGERSCATCHQLERALGDGSKLEPRLPVVSSVHEPDVPPRNVPDLWNRDHNDVAKLLWDGRVEMDDFAAHIFKLPEHIETSGFENLMAVQSVRPLIIPVEMLGDPKSSVLIGESPAGSGEVDGMAVFSELAERLIGPDPESRSPTQENYASMFLDVYGVSTAQAVKPEDIGNALAHYVEIAFQTRHTPWDRYLAGDADAISDRAKRGAILFYGTARCVLCHSGQLFSDFGFHSVGVPDDRSEKDLGRYYATDDGVDLFMFRTAPLRNVTRTAPYFHNGNSKDLVDAINQHLHPLRSAREYTEGGRHLMTQPELDAISPILATQSLVSDVQIQFLIGFLEVLEDFNASN